MYPCKPNLEKLKMRSQLNREVDDKIMKRENLQLNMNIDNEKRERKRESK